MQAFKKKVPAATPKPFDFAFDHDPDTGKCQITVKKAGADWVFGWEDTLFKANKAKLQVVEQQIATWKSKVQAILTNMTKYAEALAGFKGKVEALEKTAASGKVFEADLKEFDGLKKTVEQGGNQVQNLQAAMQQIWSGVPGDGVSGLMTKAGIEVSNIGPERGAADREFAALALGWAM